MSVPYTPLLIGNQRTGIDLGIDPWLTPQDAYLKILDAYQFRGVITKRNGYSWFDQMPYAIDGGAGHNYQNILNITTTTTATVSMSAPHKLVTGQTVRLTGVEGITPGSDGVPINGTRWTITVQDATTIILNNTVAFGGSYTVNTGTVSSLPYPKSLNPDSINIGNPITAIAVYIGTGNLPSIIVLDTLRAAIYDNSQGCLVPIGYTDQFTGGKKDLFWFENYRGVIYFTNNKDNIFYWNGTQLAVGLTAFTPQISSASTSYVVNRCLMIKALNGRLNLYNTNETNASGSASFPTRIRWCQANVDPITGGSPPTPPDLGNGTWIADSSVIGKGGSFDITDSLYIISQGQIQTNNLIISQNQQFSSIYEQRPTSDTQLPYAFVKISVSRNCNSTFGTIILDREIQMMGNTGLVLVDGNSSLRFDDKIPDFTSTVMSANDFDSAYGIRYDSKWQTWTLFTSGETSSGNNDQILVFSYQDRSFQFYRISMCVLGNVPDPIPDPEWIDYNGVTLPENDWTDFGDQSWDDVPQRNSTILLGGDYSGNVWVMDQDGGDAANNVVYHGTPNEGNPISMELASRQWFPYATVAKSAQFGYVDFLIDGDPETVVNVEFTVDNQNTSYLKRTFSCIPFEDSNFADIQNITQANPAVVTSLDHGLMTGDQVYIFAVQGMIQINNQIYTVTVIDPNNFSLNSIDSTSYDAYTGDGVLTTQLIFSEIFWTRVMAGQTGVFHQMKLTTSGVDENFKLHALILWMKPSGEIYRA